MFRGNVDTHYFVTHCKELLKQDQYSPMTVSEQVISVFTGVKGHLDDVELNEIKKFEKDIIEKVKSENKYCF